MLKSQAAAAALPITRTLSEGAWATRRADVKHTCGPLPARKRLQLSPRTHLLIVTLVACCAQLSKAVTLEGLLQTTLEKNPAIQEAKADLERAAGQRLVFRSIVWPQVELGVPAGVQYGHRAGENGVKGFGVGRGALDQTLFNVAVPASLRRGNAEVLIAQQQLNVAVVEQLHAVRLAF